MKNRYVKLLKWLLLKSGYHMIPVPVTAQALRESAKIIMKQAEANGGSGEFRRAQVMRSMMNRHPDAKERDIGLAIELEICGL